MITAKQIDKLTECYTILVDLANELDSEKIPCECCERDSWHNLAEGRIVQEVQAMARKSRKCISLLKSELGVNDLPVNQLGYKP